MALINCPECGRENVSDTATACPSCGYGIKEHFCLEKKDIIDDTSSENDSKIEDNAVFKAEKGTEEKGIPAKYVVIGFACITTLVIMISILTTTPKQISNTSVINSESVVKETRLSIKDALALVEDNADFVANCALKEIQHNRNYNGATNESFDSVSLAKYGSIELDGEYTDYCVFNVKGTYAIKDTYGEWTLPAGGGAKWHFSAKYYVYYDLNKSADVYDAYNYKNEAIEILEYK